MQNQKTKEEAERQEMKITFIVLGIIFAVYGLVIADRIWLTGLALGAAVVSAGVAIYLSKEKPPQGGAQ